MNNDAPVIYLASISPRRRELLDQIGAQYRLLRTEVDETQHAGEAPEIYVLRLALAKARAGRAALTARDPLLPVLGADTTVVVDGDILGKPRDRDDGIAMLQRLSGVTHHVYTGVALVDDDHEATRLSVSRVTFRTLAPGEAEQYWETGEPADKAGAYAVQGKGATFIKHLEGSHSGVMGLPLFETAELLREAGIDVLR